MNDTTRRAAARGGTGFTPERIARANARFHALWTGASRAPILSVYTQPVYRQKQAPEEIVASAVDCIRRDGAGGEPDILPCFWPDFGTISTARIWGGRVIPPLGERCIHIEPVASTPADLARLAPMPFEQTDFQLALDLYRQVRGRLDGDEVFVRTPDFQGPLNTLSLLMDQTAMMCAMYEEPAAIHAALDHITDVLIAYVRRFCDAAGPARVVGSIWPYICLPATMGISVTQDYMPLLGTELYREFELPRLRRIADAFGGVWIHCCGVYRQHLQSLRQGGFKIWGLEFAYPQMTPMDAYEVFGDDIVYLVGVSPDGEDRFPSMVDYARFLAEQPCARARFWFAACRGYVNTDLLREVVTRGFGEHAGAAGLAFDRPAGCR